MTPQGILMAGSRAAKTFIKIKDTQDLVYFPKWLLSLLPGNTPFEKGQPWINYKMAGWLAKNLGSEMDVFEYGSGGSTLFFAKRVQHIYSVEHDPLWYGKVKERLEEQKISNCTYVLREPDGNGIYDSHNPNYNGKFFDRYVKYIDEFKNKNFDLVFIDGRSRLNCLVHALPKIKKGGYLVLDNSQRDEYQDAIERQLAGYPRKDMVGLAPSVNGYLCQTTVWKIK